MADVRLEKVTRRFGSVVAVNNVDLRIKDKEFLVFLGPSGCGKTTTLRSIAGLEKIDAGRIFLGDREVTDLPPGQRGIGMVFQSYALFPHMTISDNIGFGLKIKKIAPAERSERVRKVAKLLYLDNLLDRYPGQLSGGQRQRVAVARALVIEPAVLLMDEPLSNLDALLRMQMRAELKKLHHSINATTIYVTHDQVEALSLGDRIAVMRDGKIVQCDVPMEIYDKPANVFVGSFIGNPPMNFFNGKITSQDGQLIIEGQGFSIIPEAKWTKALARRSEVIVGIRPENISVHFQKPSGSLNSARAAVEVVELLGNIKLLTMDLSGSVLKVSVEPHTEVNAGENVWLTWKEDKLCFYDADTEWAITPAEVGA
ncbi:MAG: ABC transporter ATP-binding protein [Limnochordia bacterium]|jgi:multiple sugar transport system ATP-binding protein